MKRIGVWAVSTALLSVTTLAADKPQGDAQAGKQLANKVCAACHGADGHATIPNYPNLAGQNAPYLVYALQAYKKGQRQGGLAAVMQAQATGLSEEDIHNLAAYYAGLPAK